MEKICVRLKKLRAALRIPTREFAAAVKYTEPSVNLFENGKRVPTDKYIKAVCRAFDVNEDWLRSGTGEMFTEKTENNTDGVKNFFQGVFSKLNSDEKKTILNALLDSMKE